MVKFAQLPKYEAYKDSGVEWLGEIPAEWNLKKFKYLLDEINIRSVTGEETLLSLSKYHGVVPKSSLEDRSGGAATLIGYKRVSIGDLVINKMQAVNGLIAVSNEDGITSPDYSVYRSKGEDLLNINYLDYLLTQPEYLGEFNRRVTGVMEGFIRLYTDDLYNIQSVLPNINTQNIIVSFLDQKTSQIDAAIAIKEQQIELLKERKQIIIQQAVTQGLDPNVPMKDSGVEWIGQIPEHWEVKKLKFLLTIKNGVDYKHVETDEGYPVYGSGGRFTYASSYLYAGEAVLLGRKGTIDKPLYVNEAFWTVDTMFYAVCNSRVMTKYIYFCATTIPYFYYSTATALPSMTQTDLLNHKIAVPSLKEQSEVIIYIEKESLKLDAAIDIGKQQIQKLKEYKTTLINSAVTGKIKITPELLAK